MSTTYNITDGVTIIIVYKILANEMCKNQLNKLQRLTVVINYSATTMTLLRCV